MKEALNLLKKYNNKNEHYHSISIFYDGSGSVVDAHGNDVFCFDNEKELVTQLKERIVDKYYNFKNQFTLDLDKNKPLYIGFTELSNYNDDGLCTLIVNPNYTLEVLPNYYKNKTALKLKIK